MDLFRKSWKDLAHSIPSDLQPLLTPRNPLEVINVEIKPDLEEIIHKKRDIAPSILKTFALRDHCDQISCSLLPSDIRSLLEPSQKYRIFTKFSSNTPSILFKHKHYEILSSCDCAAGLYGGLPLLLCRSSQVETSVWRKWETPRFGALHPLVALHKCSGTTSGNSVKDRLKTFRKINKCT
ncbi:hypothetical protein NPIL_538971 [Nephila pilipes]|uniref:Uncharacterized protein n=1 Tax=Nephila pilipes TaxID=299642 RepID=A0A8X6TRI0_NEPPI|nr:hypothetical protein NPIL_538971 [Nephila pilipes]